MPQLIVVVGGCVVVAVVGFRNHFGLSAPAHLTPRELGRQNGLFSAREHRLGQASLRLRAQARLALAARRLAQSRRGALGFTGCSEKRKQKSTQPHQPFVYNAHYNDLLIEASCW